jgi:hypothetical protein
LKVTTSGILSFDDCEKVLRPDMWKKYFSFLQSDEKRNYCVIFLSEIPLTVGEYAVNEFKLAPMAARWEPFKPYGLLLYVPKGFDYLTAPLFGEAIAPILSFSLRRRIKAHRHAYKMDNAPKEMPEDVSTRLCSISVGPEGSLQQPLTKKEQTRRLGNFGKIFQTLMGMSEKDYLATVRAFRLYQLSLLNYREDIGLAYTLLVAAIETVAECFVKIKPRFEELPEAAEWKEIFAEFGLRKKQVNKIENLLLKGKQFLGLKFREFVLNYLPDSFWTTADSKAIELDAYIDEITKEHFGTEPKEEENHFKRYWWLYTPEQKVTKSELAEVLKNIYNLRSRFAHVGESPPIEVAELYETAELKVEIDSKNRVRYRRAIPSYFWFERVVHDSIANMLKVES